MSRVTARPAAPTRDDRAEFERWCRSQVQYVETVLRIDVWNHAALRARGKVVADTIEAWRGPWATVRPYVTTEFREAVEQGIVTRRTITEWAAANARIREQERAEAEEGPGREAMSSLAYLRDLLDRRPAMIADARAAGESWESICRASGLSRSQAAKLYADWETAERIAAAELAEADSIAREAFADVEDDGRPF